MRNNQPVINREFRIDTNAVLVSRTDSQGTIAYGNDDFFTASGFSKHELLGKPHNIIRHPDMPEECFRDLWTTIKSGRPWSGLVKNRRKEGDYYWVRANVNPSVDGGYRSVRICASREEIVQASAVYEKLKTDESYFLQEGNLCHKNFLSGIQSVLGKFTIYHRLNLIGILVFLFTLIISGAGLSGINASLDLAQSTQASNSQQLNQLLLYRNLLIASTIAGLAAIFLVLVPLIFRIKSGFTKLQDAAKLIAEGKLAEPLPADGFDEIGQLTAQVSVMRNNLQELVGDLKRGLSKLAGLSNDLRNVSNESHEVVVSQSDSSAAIAANVEQLSVSIDQLELNATDANTLIAQSAEQAVKSVETLQQIATDTTAVANSVKTTSAKINTLNEITSQIFDIVKVIGEVADQTNLLALNAAIEAARAGEAGRGFAVVADEVRKLAEKSNLSSQQIQAMINGIKTTADQAFQSMQSSLGMVNEGVVHSQLAASSVEEIKNEQKQVTDIVASMAQSLAEQAEATRDVAVRLEKITQGIEELKVKTSTTHTSAENLDELIANLTKLTGYFKVAG